MSSVVWKQDSLQPLLDKSQDAHNTGQMGYL